MTSPNAEMLHGGSIDDRLPVKMTYPVFAGLMGAIIDMRSDVETALADVGGEVDGHLAVLFNLEDTETDLQFSYPGFYNQFTQFK